MTEKETPPGLASRRRPNNISTTDITITASVQQARRRRDAAARMQPMPCGHRDPWLCRHNHTRRSRSGPETETVLILSQSLAALRRAWQQATPDDRTELAAIATYLREVAA